MTNKCLGSKGCFSSNPAVAGSEKDSGERKGAQA